MILALLLEEPCYDDGAGLVWNLLYKNLLYLELMNLKKIESSVDNFLDLEKPQNG